MAAVRPLVTMPFMVASGRPLEEIYAAIFIDAIVVKVRDGQVANRPFYAAIGVALDGNATSSDSGPALVVKAPNSG
jgi:hypothetical protein